jgi:hypothetical protein
MGKQVFRQNSRTEEVCPPSYDGRILEARACGADSSGVTMELS